MGLQGALELYITAQTCMHPHGHQGAATRVGGGRLVRGAGGGRCCARGAGPYATHPPTHASYSCARTHARTRARTHSQPGRQAGTPPPPLPVLMDDLALWQRERHHLHPKVSERLRVRRVGARGRVHARVEGVWGGAPLHAVAARRAPGPLPPQPVYSYTLSTPSPTPRLLPLRSL